jgi:hypothetical protein
MDRAALLTGALAGVLAAAGVLVVVELVSRPPVFPISDADLPTAAAPATATPRAALPLVLQADGLGAMSFGEDRAAVLEQLSALLGPPNTEEQFRCAEPEADVELSGWADLTVLAFDGEFRAFGSGLHYPPTYGPPLGLRTAEGLEIGAPLTVLTDLYGDRVELLAPEPIASGEQNVPRRFLIDGEDGLRGLALDMGEGEQVIVIAAGSECLETEG